MRADGASLESPQLEIGEDGEFVFRNLGLPHVYALRELPAVLADDSEDVRERLFPNSYPDDPQKEAEWDRYSRPDLISLFESRAEIVRVDLESLTPEPVWRGYRLEIPAAHRNAWMAALNAARLILAVRGEIDEDDMERALDFEELDEKELLLLRIHLLGHLLGLLVEGEEFEFEEWPDEDYEEGDEDDDEATGDEPSDEGPGSFR